MCVGSHDEGSLILKERDLGSLSKGIESESLDVIQGVYYGQGPCLFPLLDCSVLVMKLV